MLNKEGNFLSLIGLQQNPQLLEEIILDIFVFRHSDPELIGHIYINWTVANFVIVCLVLATCIGSRNKTRGLRS